MARNIYSYIGICQAFLPAVGIAFVTGLKGFGGRVLAANPAQNLWRSPAIVTKPVILIYVRGHFHAGRNLRKSKGRLKRTGGTIAILL
jgi:hypothetical protein